MDFSLNEVQLMLADSIDKFVANEYDFDTRQDYASSEFGFSQSVWNTFAELGWTAVPFSEGDGGFDGGPAEMMVVMERFGRALVVEPYLANIVLAGGVLRRTANDAQKQHWQQPLISGETRIALAFNEPQARYALANVKTCAMQAAEGWVLSGDKSFVLSADSADVLIVPARTSGEQDSEDGITLFAVNNESPGVSIQPYATVDGLRAAEVSLRDVAATQEQLLGEVDSGFPALNAAVADGVLAVAAEALGIMTVLTEKTIEYSKSRVQFGVPISSFQALQHRMVDMYTACEQTRSLLLWAVMSASDDDADIAKICSAMKYQIDTAGRHVAEEAVQIHGGMGVTWELDVAHYFKRLIAIGQTFGNADWHLDRLARS